MSGEDYRHRELYLGDNSKFAVYFLDEILELIKKDSEDGDLQKIIEDSEWNAGTMEDGEDETLATKYRALYQALGDLAQGLLEKRKKKRKQEEEEAKKQ